MGAYSQVTSLNHGLILYRTTVQATEIHIIAPLTGTGVVNFELSNIYAYSFPFLSLNKVSYICKPRAG